MIYLVGAYKGGSGKTTTATNLAVYLWRQGRKILFCDADEQRTLSFWYELRTSRATRNAQPTLLNNIDLVELHGQELLKQLPGLAKDYDDVIIDVPGRDSTSQRAALALADIYLVPIVPLAADAWTLHLVDDLVAEAKKVNPKLRAFAFFNRVDSATRAYTNVKNGGERKPFTTMKNVRLLETMLSASRQYNNAFSYGVSHFDVGAGDTKPRQELRTLFTELTAAIHEKAKA